MENLDDFHRWIAEEGFAWTTAEMAAARIAFQAGYDLAYMRGDNS